MKKTIVSSIVSIFALPVLHAAATVNFDPTGELAGQFTGGPYSESATGGLSSSVGVTLGNISVTSFSGSQSESHLAGGFSAGNKFTVGAYFKLSNLGTGVGDPGEFLRLGLTAGAATNFTSLPFSTLRQTNATTGSFQFGARTEASDSSNFTLNSAQWYYFETTFTRSATADVVSYDMLITNSTSDGVIGSVLDTYNFTSAGGVAGGLTDATMNGVIFGGFKGHTGFTNGAAGVLDNFYVSKLGVSQIPEPAAAALGLIGLMSFSLRRRR